MKKESNKHRIFIGMSEIGGYYENLTTALEELGYVVTFYGGHSHIFRYGDRPYNMWFSKLAKLTAQKRPASFAGRLIWKFNKTFFHLICLVNASWNHDVFIFAFARTFFTNHFDLIFLRLLRKKVIVNIGHGSEARPAYLDGSYLIADGLFSTPYKIKSVVDKQYRSVRRLEKFSHFCICSPSNCHFLTKPYVNFVSLGAPHIERATNIEKVEPNEECIRIIHAPSHMVGKGSQQIRQVVSNLIEKGYKIHFKEISGVSNQQVLESLAASDLALDQLYGDLLIGGFICEASSLGVPSLICGYGFETVEQFYPDSTGLPFYAEPEQLEALLEKVINDKASLMEKGSQAYRFHKNHWGAQKVAERYTRLINDNLGNHYYADPKSMKSFHGWGMSKENLVMALKEYLSIYGSEGLMLDKNQSLKQRIIDFLNESN